MPVPFSDASLPPSLFFFFLPAILTLFFFSVLFPASPAGRSLSITRSATLTGGHSGPAAAPLGGERAGAGRVRNIETSN